MFDRAGGHDHGHAASTILAEDRGDLLGGRPRRQRVVDQTDVDGRLPNPSTRNPSCRVLGATAAAPRNVPNAKGMVYVLTSLRRR